MTLDARLEIRINRKLRDAVDTAAKGRGQSRSDVVRDALMSHLWADDPYGQPCAICYTYTDRDMLDDHGDGQLRCIDCHPDMLVTE